MLCRSITVWTKKSPQWGTYRLSPLPPPQKSSLMTASIVRTNKINREWQNGFSWNLIWALKPLVATQKFVLSNFSAVETSTRLAMKVLTREDHSASSKLTSSTPLMPSISSHINYWCCNQSVASQLNTMYWMIHCLVIATIMCNLLNN